MNDPMEGAFLSDPGNRALLQDIWNGKRRKLICCFSTDYRHTLLWSHYADSHQGCCLEVEVTSKLIPLQVTYSPDVPDAQKSNLTDILTHKSKYWDYEKEVRYIKDELSSRGNKSHPYLTVKINKVLLGYKMSQADVSFYTSLIHSILGDAIEVRQIKRDELDTGLNR